MRIKIKIVVTTILWAICIGLAIAYTFETWNPLALWSVVAGAGAAVLSAALVGDYIAAASGREIVEQIARERNATVDRAARQMQDRDRAREDRIVSRIQAAQEATLRRVASEIADAMYDPRRSS